MAFTAAGDITVHYHLAGPPGAPVVLLANSIGTSLHIWDRPAAALAERFRVLRYDMRGHGLTDATPAPYSIDRLAGDALALLDALEIGRAHVCGLSIGGMVAQRLAAGAPGRVASLVLCGTASRIGPPALWDERIAAIRAGGLAAIADGVLARWFTPAFRAGQPVRLSGYANMLVRTPAEGYIGCAMAIRDADLGADAGRIACPTLVLAGDQDQATPPEWGRALADAIPGARFALLPGAAHIPPVEQPDALAALLLDFFGKDAGHGR